MKTVLFIINPKSGTNRVKQITSFAEKHLSKNDFSISFKNTEYAGHASIICKEEKENFNIIIAVGGDGTIHEVSQELIHSNTALGIIPMGSGNGFARSLNIPLQAEKAIINLNKASFQSIDVIDCNGEYFVNMAGIGLDAEVGHAFDKHHKRGGFTYIPLVYKIFKTYKPLKVTYSFDNESFTKETFLTSFANSSQWGMNAHIAPQAKINDGKFEVVILSPIKLLQAIPLASKLFRKTIHKSKYIETISTERITIDSGKEVIMHLDGEPRIMVCPIKLQIHKSALQIFC